MRAVLGLLVAIALVPATGALGVTSSEPERFLMPGEAWAGEATIEIPCRAILETGTETSVTVLIFYDVPEHVSLDGETEVEIPKSSCLPNQSVVQETVNFALSGSKDIVARQSQQINIRAELVGSDREGETSIRFATEYVGSFEVSAPIQIKKAGPQKQISYEIQLRNLANGQTMLRFEVESHLKDGSKGQILLPDVVLLDPAGGDRDVATAVVTYATPFENGSNYMEDEFSIKVVGEYSFDPSRKANNTEVVEFGAITEGMYVPGPGLLLAPGLLVLVALLRRRA